MNTWVLVRAAIDASCSTACSETRSLPPQTLVMDLLKHCAPRILNLRERRGASDRSKISQPFRTPAWEACALPRPEHTPDGEAAQLLTKHDSCLQPSCSLTTTFTAFNNSYVRSRCVSIALTQSKRGRNGRFWHSSGTVGGRTGVFSIYGCFLGRQFRGFC